MIDGRQAPRRGFLGSMLAALGAAVVPWKTAPLRARLETPHAQPGAPACVIVWAPGAPDGARAILELIIETPTERLRRPAGEVLLLGGEGRLELALEYPYEGRVAGDYRYWAEARLGPGVAATSPPIAYTVGDAGWFS